MVITKSSITIYTKFWCTWGVGDFLTEVQSF